MRPMTPAAELRRQADQALQAARALRRRNQASSDDAIGQGARQLRALVVGEELLDVHATARGAVFLGRRDTGPDESGGPGHEDVVLG